MPLGISHLLFLLWLIPLAQLACLGRLAILGDECQMTKRPPGCQIALSLSFTKIDVSASTDACFVTILTGGSVRYVLMWNIV